MLRTQKEWLSTCVGRIRGYNMKKKKDIWESRERNGRTTPGGEEPAVHCQTQGMQGELKPGLISIWVCIAVITTHHKHSDSKQHRYIILLLWRSEVCSEFQWANMEVSVRLFSLSRSCSSTSGPSYPMILFPLQSQQWPAEFFSCQGTTTAITLTLLPLLSAYKDLWGYI